jgi:hypothetical protein
MLGGATSLALMSRSHSSGIPPRVGVTGIWHHSSGSLRTAPWAALVVSMA